MTTKETGKESGRDTRMCGDPKTWFPMRVTYQREMKVKAELDRLGIENFVPMRYKVCAVDTGAGERAEEEERGTGAAEVYDGPYGRQ